MPERLSREDWIVEGLATLEREGHDGLKADLLAKRLGVSRGSFYWHFTNLDAFHVAIAERWREIMLNAVIRVLERLEPGRRLRRLLRLSFRADASLEIAMRAWAASSDRARTTVAAVDARRVDYLERLLRAAGVGAELSTTRARILYWAYIGAALSRAEVEGAALESLIDELAGMARPETLG